MGEPDKWEQYKVTSPQQAMPAQAEGADQWEQYKYAPPEQGIGEMTLSHGQKVGGNYLNVLKTIMSGLGDVSGASNRMRRMMNEPEQEQTSPWEAIKAGGAGMMQGIKSLPELPENAFKLAMQRDAPSWLQMPEWWKDMNFYKEYGVGEKPGEKLAGGIGEFVGPGKIGKTIAKATPGILPKIIKKTVEPAATIAAHSLSQSPSGERLLEELETGALLHMTPKVAGKAAEVAGKTIGKAGELIAAPIESIRNEAKGRNLEGVKLNEQESMGALGEEAIDMLSNKLGASKIESRVNAADSLRGAYDSRVQQSNTNFENHWSNVRGKNVSEPFSPKELSDLPVVGEGANLAKKTMGETKVTQSSLVDPVTGKPFTTIEEIAGQPTVENYMKLSKEMREQAADARYEATKQNQAERDITIDRVKKLEAAADKIDQRVSKDLTPQEAKNYQDIKDFHRQQVLSFRKTPWLRSAIYDKAISSDTILPKFSEKGLNELRDSLLAEPEVADALSTYDLSRNTPFKPTTMKEIRNTLTEEVMQALPESQRGALTDILDKWNSKEAMIKDVEMQLKRQKYNQKQIDAKINLINGAIKETGLLGGARLGLRILLGGAL